MPRAWAEPLHMLQQPKGRGQRRSSDGSSKKGSDGTRLTSHMAGKKDGYRGAAITGECSACGGSHAAASCKFQAYVCRVCCRQGHLKRKCPNLSGNRAIHNLSPDEDGQAVSEESDEVNGSAMLRIDTFTEVVPFKVVVCIGGPMLLQRRSLRSRLDMLRGERQVEDNVYGAQAKQIKYARGVPRELAVGDVVSTRDFVRGRKWMSGRVQDKIGSRNYVVSVEDGPPVKRHIDQIRGGIRSLNWPSFRSPSISGTTTPSVVTNRDSTAPPVPELGRVCLRPRDTLRPPNRYGFESD
ncbi:hypothetical protein ACJJTC_006969 [Scirpophaga incertulas]